MPILLGVCACDDPASDPEEVDRQSVATQQRQYQASQPIPNFDFSLERSIAIQLYKARNQRVATWTVWRSSTGIIEGDCPSIGYPLPYDTSLTNPKRIHIIRNMNYHVDHVVEQAEPNGLFASKNSIATWIRCIVQVDGEELEAPVYTEGQVSAFPFPLEVDYDTNRVRPIKNTKPSVILTEDSGKGSGKMIPPKPQPAK